MSQDLLVNLIIAILTALTSAGGVVAFYRTRTQNKVDERTQLQQAQSAFQAQILTQLTTLSAKVDQLDVAKDKVEDRANTLDKQVERLTVEGEYRKAENEQQQHRITALQQENIEQASRLAQAEEARAGATQKWQVELAMRQFLERENNALREEVNRLHKKVMETYTRIEVPNDDMRPETSQAEQSGSESPS
jgi:chromosome segregation ATPase